MGIPVTLVGEGVDWAAWAQAVGSIVAIGAAIWIDQGSYRRSAANQADARASRLETWRGVIGQGRAALLLCVEEAAVEFDEFEEGSAIRRLSNFESLAEIYLRQEPPTAELGAGLVALKTECRAPLGALQAYSSEPSYMNFLVYRSLLDDALIEADATYIRVCGALPVDDEDLAAAIAEGEENVGSASSVVDEAAGEGEGPAVARVLST